MQRVGPRLHDLVEGAASGMAERRVCVERLDTDFLHGVLRRAVRLAAVPGGVRRAIQQKFAGLLRGSANTESRGTAAVERVYQGGSAGSDYADGKLRQHHGRAPVERQFLHFLGGDRLAERGVLGVDQGNVPGYLDRLGSRSDGEMNIEHRVVTRSEVYIPLDELFEALEGGT